MTQIVTAFVGPFAPTAQRRCRLTPAIVLEGQYLGLPDNRPGGTLSYTYGTPLDAKQWPAQANEYIDRTVPLGFKGIVLIDREFFKPLDTDPAEGKRRQYAINTRVKGRAPGCTLVGYDEDFAPGVGFDASTVSLYPILANAAFNERDLRDRARSRSTWPYGKPVIPVVSHLYYWPDSGRYLKPLLDPDMAVQLQVAREVSARHGTPVVFWAGVTTWWQGNVTVPRGAKRIRAGLA